MVNEVVTDTMLMKRYQKQTQKLEEQLIEERKRYDEKVKLLQMRKHIIIQPKKPANNRRRTWAPGHEESVDLIDFNHLAPVPELSAADHENARLANFVHEVDIDSFRGDLGADFNFGEEFVDMDAGPSFGVSERRTTFGFLNTPKALKKNGGPMMESPKAAPNRLDKDAYIQYLEEELEELQQFKRVETITAADGSDADSSLTGIQPL